MQREQPRRRARHVGPRGDRAHQCSNKIKFGSRGAAKAWAREQRDMRAVSAYECELCGEWHLSSLSKKRARQLGYSR